MSATRKFLINFIAPARGNLNVKILKENPLFTFMGDTCTCPMVFLSVYVTLLLLLLLRFCVCIQQIHILIAFMGTDWAWQLT